MLGIIALIGVFIAAYFAYKTAVSTGRSGPIWALITLAVGLGFQIVLPVLIGIIMGIVFVATGTPVDQIPEKIQGPAAFIGLPMLILSVVGIWLILRHISRLPEDKPAGQPPPPPTFES